MPLMVIQIGPNKYGDLAFTATSLFDGERDIKMNLQSDDNALPILHLVNASKSFVDKTILCNATFIFEHGKKYLITGPSGTGKTALLNVLAGLDHLDDGRIETETSTVIQYLFQDVLLFSDLSARENLLIKQMTDPTYMGNLKNEIISNALTAVGIDHTTAEKKVSLLSGGEQRRVQLAQLLMFGPDLVLLDEPTANLDYKNKQELIELINTLFPNATIIISSHDIEYIPNDYIRLELQNGDFNNER